MNVLDLMKKTKKKAVSPVVAAILLIGLVVVAGAAIMFIVLPMLNPAPNIENVEATVTKVMNFDDVTNTTTFEITITNTNTVAVKLVGFSLLNGTDTVTTATKPVASTYPITITLGEIVKFQFDDLDYSEATSITLTFTDNLDVTLGTVTVTF
ncbi:MAG: archaellin/type IV pilin N-terminal domain-containing protein [Candidatus Hodarchaeales archaeon]|jgi:flagellin-like protein